MIQLVHWKEFVDPGFMQKFIEIEKALASAKKFDRVNLEEDNIAKRDSEIYRIWKTIRWKMLHAGYESMTDGKKIFWCPRGWCGIADIIVIDGVEKLKFRYMANNNERPIYISVSNLMKLRNEIEQDKDEESYYKPTAGIYTQALSKKYNKGNSKFIPTSDKSFPVEMDDAHDF